MTLEKTSVKDVAVILVGLNACDYVCQCLQSLGRAEWRGYSYETIYVDNGSTDGTVSALRAGGCPVEVLENKSNVGFCKAANQGARIANARHYLFINDDTVVLDDAVPLLVEYLDQHPEAGCVGSRLLYPDMTEQWSGRSFPSPWNAILGRRSLLSRIFPNAKILKKYLNADQVRGNVPFPVDWLSAAAIMVRKEIFERVGGFAEDYYYWHEAVFCDRVRKAGGAVILHPLSRIIHYEGKGSGSRPFAVRKWHILDFHKSAFRCYCEHYNLGKLNPLRWLAAAGLATRAACLLLANRIATLRPSAKPAETFNSYERLSTDAEP